MSTLYLIVEAGGTELALPAFDIHSVFTCGHIVPVPHAASYVAGLAALRSEVITVVDPIAAIRGTAARSAEAATLVAIEIEGHHYGLMVDDVHDAVVVEESPQPCGAAMDGGWKAIAMGTVIVDGRLVIAIEPKGLVAAAPATAA